MNHLDIDHAVLQQIRSLFGHVSPAATPSLKEPPRTARALALLGARWEEVRRASEGDRRARLGELERFVGVTQSLDVNLSARLEGSE
ncbi:hypothetical protein FQK23_08125 [Corynebacterium aurimucosum]|uniref:Uncharacterized protein n=1 Tax=Corynebacterium aurimucosum TaxID=169292 RepID=A0A558GHX8_9CORY|nr:hypothetical protein [Corynebacterium sp. HMSC066C02]OFP20119.1 hypothetical protein HMPREF2996_06945 [Corynebacterium sp. HMSC066C02]TVU56448.1 hypothetical protein FQK23_08125 [Corynebacterium aurimucosum]